MTNLYNYQESLDKLPDIVPIYVHALLLGGAAEMYSSLFLSLSDSLGAWEIWQEKCTKISGFDSLQMNRGYKENDRNTDL